MSKNVLQDTLCNSDFWFNKICISVWAALASGNIKIEYYNGVPKIMSHKQQIKKDIRKIIMKTAKEHVYKDVVHNIMDKNNTVTVWKNGVPVATFYGTRREENAKKFSENLKG